MRWVLSYKFTAVDAENGFHLYAHWTKGITVHFDGNGYKGTLKDKTVTPDKVYLQPALSERATTTPPTRHWTAGTSRTPTAPSVRPSPRTPCSAATR